jgi:hypothetical protein
VAGREIAVAVENDGSVQDEVGSNVFARRTCLAGIEIVAGAGTWRRK